MKIIQIKELTICSPDKDGDFKFTIGDWWEEKDEYISVDQAKELLTFLNEHIKE